LRGRCIYELAEWVELHHFFRQPFHLVLFVRLR
jgi:hypothetical protein